MRCFVDDFWKQHIWKKILKNFRSPKNFEIFFLLKFWVHCHFFSKIFKNRKISKCSKIDYFSSILIKRARDWNEMFLCRFLTKNNFGKFFEKFSKSKKIRKFLIFPPKFCQCAWCATCVHIRHMCLRASKNKTSASYSKVPPKDLPFTPFFQKVR